MAEETINDAIKGATLEAEKLNKALEKSRSLLRSAGSGIKNVGGRALSFLQPLEVGGSVAGGQNPLRATTRSITEYAGFDYAIKAAKGWETWGKIMERVADRTVRSTSRIGQALGKMSQISARISSVAFNPMVVGVSSVISAYYELSAAAKKAADDVEKHNKRLKYAFQGMGGSQSGLLRGAGIAAGTTGMSRAQTIQLMGQAGSAGFGAMDSQRIVRIAHAIAREQGQEISKAIGGVIQNATIATAGMTQTQASGYLQQQALSRTKAYSRPTLQQELERTGRWGVLQERAEGLRSEARYERYWRPLGRAVGGAGEALGFMATGGLAGHAGTFGGERATSAALNVVGQINRGRTINAFYDVKDYASRLRRSGGLTRARQLREGADRGLRDVEIERLSQQLENEQTRVQKATALTASMQSRNEAVNYERRIASIDKQLQTGNLSDEQKRTLRREKSFLSIKADRADQTSRNFVDNLGLGDKLGLLATKFFGGNTDEATAQLIVKQNKTRKYLRGIEKEKESEFTSFREAATQAYYEGFDPDKVNSELESAQKKVTEFAKSVHEMQVLLDRNPQSKELKESLNKMKQRLAGAQAKAGKLEAQQQIFDIPAVMQLQDTFKFQERALVKGQTEVALTSAQNLGLLNESDLKNLEFAKTKISDPEKRAEMQQRVIRNAQSRAQIKTGRFEASNIKRNMQNEKNQIRLAMESLGLKGRDIRSEDREEIERLLESDNSADLQNAKSKISLISQEQQTKFARVDLGIQRAQLSGGRRLLRTNIAIASRRGIVSGSEAERLGGIASTGLPQEQEAVNKILQIKEEAFQREIEFTTKYTQARLEILSAHYDKARGLEELRVQGRERQQAPFLQFGQTQFGLNQIGQQVQSTAVGVAEQQLAQARGFRDIGRARRDLVLGFAGVQKPRAVQFMEQMQAIRERERDMQRAQQQQISQDTMGFSGMADTLESLRGQGITEDQLRQTSGGRQFLLQMYQQNQAGFERAGVGDQARQRIGGLVQQERQFAGRQLKLQLRTRQLTKEEYERKVGVVEKQLAETPEGEKRQLVQANLAGTYRQAAEAARERGDVEGFEKYMSKYEKAIEGLPDYLKGIYDDANKITNSLLTTQNDILRAINAAVGGTDVGKSSAEGKVGGGATGGSKGGKSVGQAAEGQAHGGSALTMLGGLGFNVAPQAAYSRGFGSLSGGGAGLGISPMRAVTDEVGYYNVGSGFDFKKYVGSMGLPSEVISSDRGLFGSSGDFVRKSNRSYQAREGRRRAAIMAEYEANNPFNKMKARKLGRKQYIKEYMDKISAGPARQDVLGMGLGGENLDPMSGVNSIMENEVLKMDPLIGPGSTYIEVPNVDTGIQTSPDVSTVTKPTAPEDKMGSAADKMDKAADKLMGIQIDVKVQGPGTASVKSGSGSYSPTEGGS